MTKHAKILIIDDDANIRVLIARILESRGYQSLQAANTNEALEQLKSHVIDLCVLDINMPGKQGDDFLKDLKRAYPEVAVIMSTGVSDLEVAVKCSDLGADDYILKPFEPSRFMITLHNVLERKHLAQENRFYRVQLEKKVAAQAEELKTSQQMLIQQEKLAAIGQLAAGVAHEINNPVGYVSGNLSALRKYGVMLGDFIASLNEIHGTLPPEQQSQIRDNKKKYKIDYLLEDIPELINDSLEGTEKIKSIVQGLKCFSRTDSETPEMLDIDECLESAVTIVWNEIKYNSTLERDFAEVPKIHGFPQQLAQVFMNLMVNASHAINDNGQIRLTTRHEGEQVVVTVSDNGCGIAEADLAKIFDPFFTTKEVGKGTGLGMSIVNEIVQKHGGKIKVDSKVGKGTTFTVSLPTNNNA